MSDQSFKFYGWLIQTKNKLQLLDWENSHWALLRSLGFPPLNVRAEEVVDIRGGDQRRIGFRHGLSSRPLGAGKRLQRRRTGLGRFPGHVSGHRLVQISGQRDFSAGACVLPGACGSDGGPWRPHRRTRRLAIPRFQRPRLRPIWQLDRPLRRHLQRPLSLAVLDKILRRSRGHLDTLSLFRDQRLEHGESRRKRGLEKRAHVEEGC